ncbi:MAG: hypothetical protein AB1489_19525, partial [Acidobacteriota bacterium]
MKILNSRIRIAATSVALLLCLLYQLLNDRSATAFTKSNNLVAIKLADHLLVNIPFLRLFPALEGRLIVEIVDTQDKVLARQVISSELARSTNSWQAKLSVKGINPEDLIWQRLRCRFIPNNGAKISDSVYLIKQIFNYPTVRLIGQHEIISGSTSSLRLLVLDGKTGVAVSNGSVQLTLGNTKEDSVNAQAVINRHGTADLRLTVPADLFGEENLQIYVRTPIGECSFTEKVTVAHRYKMLLTMDKPVYQPCHLIYIRSLVLDQFSRAAVAQQHITFE